MPNPTAVNAVRKHLQDAGLPPNLLPGSIERFTLNADTGRFEVHFTRTTKVKAGSHEVTFREKVTGHLGPRVLSELDGVSVKVVLMHPAVTRVEADDARTTVSFTVMGTVHDVAFSAFD